MLAVSGRMKIATPITPIGNSSCLLYCLLHSKKTVRRSNLMTKVKQYFHNMPRHIAIIGAFLAGIIVAGVIFWVSRSNPQADASLTPRAARIERVEGSVGLSHAQAQPQAQTGVAESEWEEATRNAPLTTGDRVSLLWPSPGGITRAWIQVPH
jgi:hypothetical protein